MLIKDDGLTPNHGELVICDWCGKTYEYFIWSFGSDRHLCRGCVQTRPSAYLDNIDAIDLEEEQRIIDEEWQEQQDKDYPPVRRNTSSRRVKGLTGSEMRKIQRRQDRETIAKFKPKGVVDVTKLG